MRRLFIALLPLLFIGCDTNSAPDVLVGTWELVEVSSLSGETVDGPLGSRLVFESDGELRIDSVNDCSGGAFGVAGDSSRMLRLEVGGCTFIGVPPESDLSQFLLALSDPPGDVQHVHGLLLFPFAVRESIPLQLVLDAPQRDTRLVFRPVQ